MSGKETLLQIILIALQFIAIVIVIGRAILNDWAGMERMFCIACLLGLTASSLGSQGK